MDSKKRKFELLPSFLKAGVYYTQKLETVRQQSYWPRYFAYDLITKDAEREFMNRNFDRACRKYEEVIMNFNYCLGFEHLQILLLHKSEVVRAGN